MDKINKNICNITNSIKNNANILLGHALVPTLVRWTARRWNVGTPGRPTAGSEGPTAGPEGPTEGPEGPTEGPGDPEGPAPREQFISNK